MTENKQQQQTATTYTANALDALQAMLDAQKQAEKAKAEKQAEPFDIMKTTFGKQVAPWGLIWAFTNNFGHFVRLVVDTKASNENLLKATIGLDKWDKDNAQCKLIKKTMRTHFELKEYTLTSKTRNCLGDYLPDELIKDLVMLRNLQCPASFNLLISEDDNSVSLHWLKSFNSSKKKSNNQVVFTGINTDASTFHTVGVMPY